MIISASYKTDIPTFYGDWFMRRLHAGYCKSVNPYSRQVYRVPLDRQAVDGFVFWTKNIAPFLKHLPAVRERGFPFVVQYTINGYRMHELGLMSAWHYKHFSIELSRRGRSNEPEPLGQRHPRS